MYEPHPEAAIVALTPSSTARDRVAAVQLFVQRWYGTVAHELVLPPMPPPLASLHRLAAANPRLVHQNRLVAVDQLVERDGRVRFYDEHQSVCDWSFDAGGEDDPAVWYRENDHRASWQREAEPLSGFLLQLVLFEAALGSHPPYSGAAGWLPNAATARVRERFARLPLAPWVWGQATFHAREGALLVLFENGPDGSSLNVAAQRPGALAFLRDLVDSHWDVADL